MNVLLIQPPIGKRIVSNTPPVGIAYIAAVLMGEHHDVSCLACDAIGLDTEQAAQQAMKQHYDIIGFSVASLAASSTVSIIRSIRQANCTSTIIVGGPHPTIFPNEFLENGADYVVRGEGEITIVELLTKLQLGEGFADVNGLSFQENGRLINTPPRELIKDLDTLPFPAWALLPIEQYRSDFKASNRSLPILTSRGCPGKCVFCYKGLFGNRFRIRTPASIVDEIEQLKCNFNIDEFAIVDDNFVSSKKRAIEVCKLLLERNVNLPWSLPSGVRVDMVDYEVLDWIKKAGCYRLGFGVESGNQHILNSIRKGVTKDQVRKAISLAKEFQFITSAFFMIGNLEETEATINETIRFAVELDPDMAQFSVATPYPGTEMFERLHRNGKILTYDWDKYDGFSAKEPIFVHDNVEPSALARLMRKAYLTFYLRPSYIIKYAQRNLSLRGFGKMIRAGLKFIKIIS